MKIYRIKCDKCGWECINDRGDFAGATLDNSKICDGILPDIDLCCACAIDAYKLLDDWIQNEETNQ